jgi:hypothetical protein
MLRALTIALFVANLAWWAWHTPLLGLSAGDAAEREPQRLAHQVNAEQIRVLSSREATPAPVVTPPAATASAAASSASSALPVATRCLEAGPLDEAGFAIARRELLAASVAADGWVDMRREKPASHAVYMGRFPDEEQLRRKREELQRINVSFETYAASSPAGLAPGLTLGRYPDNAQAQARLRELQAKGVRTARVVVLAPASTEHTLRVDRASPAQHATLTQAATAASGPTSGATHWRGCADIPAP